MYILVNVVIDIMDLNRGALISSINQVTEIGQRPDHRLESENPLSPSSVLQETYTKNT